MAKAMDRAAAAAGKVLPCAYKGGHRHGTHRLCPYPGKTVGALRIFAWKACLPHFACADMEDEQSKAVTQQQYDRYLPDGAVAGRNGPPHSGCAIVPTVPGSWMKPQMHKDMVRAGIILYGLYPSDEMPRSALDLKPVMSLKSHITIY